MASNQSRVIKNRILLENKLENLKKIYLKESPNRPKNWGGFKISPISFEFWQGRPNRLHDRIIFNKVLNKWSVNRLAP